MKNSIGKQLIEQVEACDRDVSRCAGCGKIGDYTIHGAEGCYYCGNEIDFCSECFKKLAETIEALKL